MSEELMTVSTETIEPEKPTDDEDISKLLCSPEVQRMHLIASNQTSEIALGQSSDSVNQIKLFLVAQAKNELRRIVKLTNYLDTVENQFIETSAMLMSEYPDNLSIISEVMKSLTACINRSNELITQVVSDDKLNSYMFNQEMMSTNKSSISLESRNKIRSMASKMLSQLDKDSEVTDSE